MLELVAFLCISFTMQMFPLLWFTEHKMATVQSHLKDYHGFRQSIYYGEMTEKLEEEEPYISFVILININ